MYLSRMSLVRPWEGTAREEPRQRTGTMDSVPGSAPPSFTRIANPLPHGLSQSVLHVEFFRSRRNIVQAPGASQHGHVISPPR